MLNQYYIKTENRINYAKKYPNSGIKCSVCQLIFCIDQIEHHMSIHIAPQYMAPSTKPNEIKKMSRPKIFLQQKQNQFMSSALKSIRKQELPKYETLRNFKDVPSQINPIEIHKYATPSFIGTEITNHDQFIFETTLEVNNIDKDFFPKQNILQNLLITRQNLQIHKNTVAVYKAQQIHKPQGSLLSTGNSWIQPIKAKGKEFQQSKPNHSVNQGYEITIQKQKENKGYLSVFQTEPEQQCQVNVQIYKPPEVRSQSICTKTKEQKQLKKSSSFQFLAQFFGCKQSSTETRKGQIVISMDKAETASSFYRTQSQKNFHTRKEHKCQDCQGFYCAACQSTIPPQYRPASVFSKDQQTTNYYRNVVYRNDSCGKVNELGQQRDCKDCAQ